MKTPTASFTTRNSSKSNTGFTTRDCARLHPQTVTNWTEHRRKLPKGGRKASRITTLRVDPRIWEAALTLSQGNPRRIQVIDELTVIVHNNPL